MNRFARVLVAVDFSDPARAAFDCALALSQIHKAELSFVHAVPGERSLRWHARERTAMIAELRRITEAAGVPFNVSVQHGDPADVILQHAGAAHADLIVLGTHQRSGIDRFRLGSVAETVTVQAMQPVLIVPSPPAGSDADSAMSFDRILVAVDFSTGSIGAVERALAISDVNSHVTLVHVVPGIPPPSAAGYSSHSSEPEYQTLLVQDASRRLQETIPATSRTSRKVHTCVVTGDASTEIARIAAEVDADIIFVGVTARGSVGRRIFGSTAARVIRTAGRPVLAVPELDDQSTVDVSEEDQPA